MAFLCVSQQGEFKNTIQIFSKIRPENLKKSQKKVGFLLGRPLYSYQHLHRHWHTPSDAGRYIFFEIYETFSVNICAMFLESPCRETRNAEKHDKRSLKKKALD
jgi:hypothetical protein